jgi:hypothetical protein
MFDLEYYNKITDFGKEVTKWTKNSKVNWRTPTIDRHLGLKNLRRQHSLQSASESDSILYWQDLIGIEYVEWYLHNIYRKSKVTDQEIRNEEFVLEKRAKELKL